MKLLRFIAILLFATNFAFCAQQPDQKPTGGKPAAGERTGGMMTKNVAELDKYAKMVLGTWSVQESHDAASGMPAGASTGTATFQKGPGGYSVVERLSMNGSMGKISGMGVVWYDLKDQAYKGVWCDSMTPYCDTSFSAKWEGPKLVATGSAEMPDGKTMYMREEYTDITPNSLTFTMYGGADPNSVTKFMTMKYTRKSGPAPATRPDIKK